jgi:hypothetical protein
MASPPCASAGVRINCDSCNRHSRIKACFDNHKSKQGTNKKSSCELRKCCGTCGALITYRKHERNNCNEKKEINHMCLMRLLMNEPASSEHMQYVFHDFENTQHTNRSNKASVHMPHLVCLLIFCSKCKNIAHIVKCGKRKRSCWDDSVGDMFSYQCQPGSWIKKRIVLFIMRRFTICTLFTTESFF